MYLNYPDKIVNNKILRAEQLNNNFGAIEYVVNGNISGENFADEAELTLNKLTTQEQKVKVVKVGDTINITLPDSSGASSVRFFDKNNTTIMKIGSDGVVEL